MSIYQPSSAAEAWIDNLDEVITTSTLQRAFAAGYGEPNRHDVGRVWVAHYFGSIDRLAVALAYDAGHKHANRFIPDHTAA